MKTFNINKLRVASPCHIRWENMDGGERVRFCQSCQLNVFNISELTSIEVENLITTTEGRICGRIYRKADGTVLTKDCPVGLRHTHQRIAKFAGAVFASIIGLFSFASAQEKNDDKKHEKTGVANFVRNQIVAEVGIIRGVISDMYGAIIPNAEISITDLATKKKITVKSDDSGNYKFPSVSAGKYKIIFKVSGFRLSRISEFSINKHEMIVLNVKLEFGEIVTVGIFSSEPLIDTTSSHPTYIIKGD